MQARDRGFTAAFTSALPDAVALDLERARAERGFAKLTRRAKVAGVLRRDFSHHDLALLMMANGGLVGETVDETATASRRLVAYLLQSFRAGPTIEYEKLPPVVRFGLHTALETAR